MNFSVSIIGLIVGMLFNMGLGMLWYSNVLFAKPWMEEAGITEEDVVGSEMGKVYGFTALSALLTSYVIGFLIVNLDLNTIAESLVAGFLIWAGTNIPPIIKNWGFENRTIKLGIINHGYDLVVYLVVSVVYVIC